MVTVHSAKFRICLDTEPRKRASKRSVQDPATRWLANPGMPWQALAAAMSNAHLAVGNIGLLDHATDDVLRVILTGADRGDRVLVAGHLAQILQLRQQNMTCKWA